MTLLPVLDIILCPIVFPAAYLLKAIRRAGIQRMPLCKRVLLHIGVFPIRNHYYEPLFDARELRHSLSHDRHLPGIDWNVGEQIALLEKLCFSEELKNVSSTWINDITFYMNNVYFTTGDAEYLYNIIRLKKPTRLIEIGSGHSTLIAKMAIDRNRAEDDCYACKHVCIEPYERPWLEGTGVTVVREMVECVDKAMFAELQSGDILFIDSSHVIRPQGDVVLEYLELLPSLRKGVVVHIHDIFSPRDYPREWVIDDVRLWNEQYLLEAFLTCNRDWKIIGALNFLHHGHFELLADRCPFLTREREPGSFYIEKVN
jgi:hypothetical protein